MTQRRLTIVLHWVIFMLVLIMIKGGTAHPFIRLTFVLLGGFWIAMALIRGIMARPGPKLAGPLRHVFIPLHIGMYGLLGIAVALNSTALLEQTPLAWAWNALLVLFIASLFHAILHLWRHTVLNDGALRMILPRAWHKHL